MNPLKILGWFFTSTGWRTGTGVVLTAVTFAAQAATGVITWAEAITGILTTFGIGLTAGGVIAKVIKGELVLPFVVRTAVPTSEPIAKDPNVVPVVPIVSVDRRLEPTVPPPAKVIAP